MEHKRKLNSKQYLFFKNDQTYMCKHNKERISENI